MAGSLMAVGGWLYVLLVTAAVLLAVLRRREPASALGWALSIVFVPVLGLLLFLVFGLSRVPRRLRRRIAHHARFRERFPVPGEEPADRAPGVPSTLGTPDPPLRPTDRPGASRPPRAPPRPGSTPAAPPREVADPDRGVYPAGPWGDVGRMLQALEEGPRRPANRVAIFDDGLLAFERMGEAIRAARHHVHVEFYIFRDDELGRGFLDLLARRAREGVEVRLLVDAVGSMGSRRMLRRLARAGGEAEVFLPLRPFGKRFTPNLRNHRKIVVVDGAVGFFGGLNVGKEYLGRRVRGRDWYDLHVEVGGPAVWDLQRIFVEDWDFTTSRLLGGADYFPPAPPGGRAPVQVVSGGPDVDVNPIRQAFLAAFFRARRRILLLTPYLVPDLALRDALSTAARTGVAVDVLLPRPPGDSLITHLCGEYYVEELLQAGVRVHAYAPGMMHAKALVVDGEWALVGTANLDNRSLHLNFEQVAIFDGRAEVEEIEARVRQALDRAVPVDREGLARRPAVRRVAVAAARLLAPLL